METKQTAIEQMYFEIKDYLHPSLHDLLFEIYEKYKHIEKEQIIDALNYDCYRNQYPENYYEERYGY